MPLDTGSEPPRKKQRTAKSCEQCRHRKVRCDQRFPCGPCCRSRGRLSCAYRSLPGDAVSARDLQPGPVAAAATAAPGAATTTTAVTPATAAGGASGSSQAPPAHDRPARASTSGNHVGRVGQSAGGLRASSSSFPRIGASDHTVDLLKRLEVRIQRVEDQAGRELHARDGGESAEPESLRVAPVVPRFRFSQDKVRIFGEAHWMHAMSKMLTSLLFNPSGPPNLEQHGTDLSKAVNELRSIRSAIKERQQTEASPDLTERSHLPPRQVCKALVEGYLRTFERLYCILDVSKFLKQSDQFWEGTPSLPKIFAVKYALVMAIGLPFTPLAGSIEQRASLARRWINAAQVYLSVRERTTRNIQGLEIFCLLIVARQANGLRPSQFFSPAALLSLAMQMGLHSYKHSSTRLSTDQTRTLSRLWLTVVELCLSSSLDDGTLPPRSLRLDDTDAPFNLTDTELADGTASENSYSEKVQGRETSSLHAILHQSQHLRMQALEIINSPGPRPSYNTIIDLASHLQTACHQSSTFFASHAAKLGPDARFQRRYIDMYLRKHILLLHRPFMLEAHRDPRLYLSRKICLETSMIMASYTDDILLPSPLRDDFASSMVHGRGHLRGGLSLDVSITLAYEVNTQLLEERGTRVNTRNSQVAKNGTFGAGAGAGATVDEQVDEDDDDPAHKLARAARAPILQRLKHIQTQLFEIILAGCPDFKRYLLLCAVLAKLKALEADEDDSAAFLAGVTEHSIKCAAAVQAFVNDGARTATAGVGVGSTVADNYKEDSTDASRSTLFGDQDFDLMDMDLGLMFDPLTLFNHGFYDCTI